MAHQLHTFALALPSYMAYSHSNIGKTIANLFVAFSCCHNTASQPLSFNKLMGFFVAGSTSSRSYTISDEKFAFILYAHAFIRFFTSFLKHS